MIESARDQSVMLAQLEVMDAKVDEILRLLRGSGTLQQAEVAGITGFAIRALAKRIAPEVEDTEQALHELERAVEIAVRVRDEGRQGSNLGDFVDKVLRRSAELTGEGDYDAADAEIEAALQREAEESKVREIRLLERGIDTALLRRDAVTAAQRIARRTELELPDGENLWAALRSVQNEWYEQGRDKGLNLYLEVVIKLAEVALRAASDSHERGMCFNDLGVALQTLGERESGTARLEKAIAAYRAVLKEWTRHRVPFDWTMMQTNLGNALAVLGARESGTARLEEAVSACRTALGERTRERVPLEWAETQNVLGNALRILGERESGTRRLEEAVLAYRAALEEQTRERLPLKWDQTQAHLRVALDLIAKRTGGLG